MHITLSTYLPFYSKVNLCTAENASLLILSNATFFKFYILHTVGLREEEQVIALSCTFRPFSFPRVLNLRSPDYSSQKFFLLQSSSQYLVTPFSTFKNMLQGFLEDFCTWVTAISFIPLLLQFLSSMSITMILQIKWTLTILTFFLQWSWSQF